MIHDAPPSCPARGVRLDDDEQPPIAVLALLVFASMVSSTLLIPAARPLMAALQPGHEGAIHAFMTVNMAGAIIGAPLVAWWSERTGHRRLAIIVLALIDGSLLYVCSLPLPLWALLGARTLQGAANVGGLSLLLGLASSRGRAMGIVGAALMMAVAFGAPLGTALLKVGPLAPLQLGALLPFAVAAGTFRLRGTSAAAAPRRSLLATVRAAPELKIPTLLVAVERFTVGAFVVTFALYCHRALGLSDTAVGALFSWFLLPFALCTWPMGRVADRVRRSHLVKLGGLLYGGVFLILGLAPPAALWVLMLVAGVASSAIYAPSLCYAATLAPRGARGTAMALLNAGGSLGMMVGTALGGILSAVLMRSFHADMTYPIISARGGAAPRHPRGGVGRPPRGRGGRPDPAPAVLQPA